MRLHATGLEVRFGDRIALAGVDLRAEPGEVLAVLGANGSGKSTLMRALAGLVPFGGTLRWDDRAQAHNAPVLAGIGYMPQDSAMRAALTAFEVVLLGRLGSLTLRVDPADLAAAGAAMAELGIAGLASRRIGELSGGQRQLVFMAQVLAGEPRVLLLDEPTSALDIAHQLHVLDHVREATRRRGLTTVAVLHDLNAAARFADRVALLREGRLLGFGRPAEVLAAPTLRTAYDVDVSVLDGPDRCPVIVPLRVAS